ncbi:MAG: hypothetical protein IKY83_11280 [Proteobacteria bacterium]|nr:hypothetical protein [Pseudomonadota bacterium]
MALTTEERLQARQFNMRARQIFWRGILPDSHTLYHLDEDAIVDWVLEFQKSYHLLQDGKFGPSSLITFMANTRGGIGNFIIDGKEINDPGARVARMFTAAPDATKVKPDLTCLLSIPEIDYISRDRFNGRAKVRAHFSIDSSIGQDNESLIIQWADPMREVPFTPTSETVDYPRRRQCVGIEIENVLLLYQLDSDERRWLRRRPVIRASIGNRLINQPMIYEPQIKALKRILRVLEQYADIPAVFPVADNIYRTDLLEESEIQNYKGCLAKFNYFLINNEPGAGLVPHLETLFGGLSQPDPENSDTHADAESQAAKPHIAPLPKEPPKPIDLNSFEAQKAELAKTKTPTSTFVPTSEDTPKFNLANAIASAYASGKAGRAGRIVEKCTKFEDS